MKSKKIILTLLIIALIATTNITSVAYGFVIEEQIVINKINHVVTPFWINVDKITPVISVDGTTIYSDTYIKAKKSTNSISGTIYLEKYVSNKWTTETSWSISGTGSASLSKSYTGKSGVKYRIKVVVSIGGEKATVYSDTCGL